MTGRFTSEITPLALLTIILFFLSPQAFAAHCDRACLLEQAKQFNAAMLAHNPEEISLAPDAQIRENTKAIALRDSKWSGVAKILSEGVFADPTLGNVIEHVSAQTAEGKAVYIGTRLKVLDGKVKEVEINFDDNRVNLKNLVPYTRSSTPFCRLRSVRPESNCSASLLPISRGSPITSPLKQTMIPAATATTVDTGSRTTRGMALRRVGTSAATRAISGRSPGARQPKFASDS
jgi:hypothetical protein